MFYLTDDSTLPSSTPNSDTASSSQSFSSSNEQLEQSLDFLDHSWPLSREPGNLDKLSRKVNNHSCRSDLKKISRNSSNASTPRSRPDISSPRTRPDQTAARGCSSDASALYSNTRKHYNPSVSGQHACQEMSDYRDWANSYLQYSPHNTFINDLSRDLADGQTLLYLVEELLGVCVEPVHVKPVLQVQKIENIQTCIDVLATLGIPVHDLSPKDVVEANPKVTLVLCKYLKQHFGSTPGSPQGSAAGMTTTSRRTPSPRTKHTVIPPVGYHGTATSFPVMDSEDVAALDWVGLMTGKLVTDYNSFQDGHILCLLINKLTDGAVPDVVLDYGLPSEKVSLALMSSKEELGVTCDLSPDDVVNLNDVSKMSSLLKTLYRVFLDQVQVKEYDMRTQERNKPDSNYPRELMADRRKPDIELVCEAQIAPRSFGERETLDESKRQSDLTIQHPCLRKDEERILVPNMDKMSLRLPSVAKRKSKRRQVSKERSVLGENGLQDRGDDRPCENQSNHTKDISYFIEDLANRDNSYTTISPTSIHNVPFLPTDVSIENSRNKSSPHSLDALPCYAENLMLGLLPKESIFDSEKKTFPCTMPHASRSWQKERENAQHQLNDFKNELQRLKEEYFKLMNMKTLQTSEHNSLTKAFKSFTPVVFISEEDRGLVNTDNVECNSVDKMANKGTILPEKPVKKSAQTSSCVMAYVNVKKGTLPPYRTWSIYENTDGDRYRCYSTKNIINLNTKRSRHETNTTTKSTECLGRQADHAKQINPDCDNLLVSSSKKEVQEFKLRGNDDEPSGVNSKRVSGRHRYGMTALARLSSKKANAVSDTDN